jgi:anti-anti-sigma factor
MQIQFAEVETFKKVALSGRLDSANIGALEAQFSAGVVPTGRDTLVDLTEVEFLASLAVRMLISAARALSSRGAKLVMFGANEAVTDTIETMGFTDIVPLALTERDAIELLRA